MDAGIIGATYFFSWYLRFKSGLFVQDAGVLPAKTYFSALFLIIPGYLLLYSIFQLYMPRRVKSYRKELMDIIRANGIGFMILALIVGVVVTIQIFKKQRMRGGVNDAKSINQLSNVTKG